MCGVTRYLQWFIDSCFLLGERIMCVESSGVTRYLQWYIDSCFLLGERIMCAESAGVTRYLQWYADSCFLQGERIMCVTLSLPCHTGSSTQSGRSSSCSACLVSYVALAAFPS